MPSVGRLLVDTTEDREDFWDPAVPSCIKASRVPGGSRLWLMVVGVGLMGGGGLMG